ncbi:hypothetical protein [Chryseobacterium sp.]|uniref:hypothetical protein n=1 Tax=Chryseobacterium sp. TaxID=1871047 RepID=UPI003219CC95
MSNKPQIISTKLDIYAFAQEELQRSKSIIDILNNHCIDAGRMAKEDPHLFMHATNIFRPEFRTNAPADYAVDLFNMYEEGYHMLKSRGAFETIPQDRDELMTAQMHKFLDAVDDPTYRIPVEEIEEVISSVTRRRVTTAMVEFNPFMRLIEKYYEVNHRDFFKARDSYESFAGILGWTIEQARALGRVSPQDSAEAAALSIYSNAFKIHQEVINYDWWYELITNNWDVVNGCVRTLYAPEEGDEYPESPRERIGVSQYMTYGNVPGELKAAFPRAVFKELKQVFGDIHEVECSISW